jgi:NADH-quinone oxidoreductase subunit L
VQLLFATYNMRSQNPWRLVTLIIFSFTVVVIGYTLVSHAFTRFLYPEPGFVASLYASAHIDLTWFDALIVLLALVIGFGWISAYYADRSAGSSKSITTRMWMSFYALISREFYVADLYAVLTRWLLAASARINGWLRWG